MINHTLFRIILLIAGFIYNNTNAFGQYENHVWYFGEENIGIKFDLDTNEPQAYNFHQPLNREGCSIATNPTTGEVLFYTDGRTVYNAQNLIVENGEDLGACPSSAQAAVIVPVPGSCNEYYVFSNSNGNDCDSSPKELYYSKVDMKANNGLGAVLPVIKKTLLKENVNEGMIVLPRSGTSDFWLIGADDDTGSSHYIYLVHADGIQWHNSYMFEEVEGLHYCFSYSPDFTKIAGSMKSGLTYSLNFDPFLGVLSNYLQIQRLTSGYNDFYDSDWSGDGSKLYYSTVNDFSLYQYDFNNNQNTQIPQASNSGAGIKRGPDDRIYFINDEDSKYLSIIENPNAPASLLTISEDGYSAGDKIKSINFPQTMATPNTNVNNSNLSGVINEYAAVSGICNNSITIQNPEYFNVGDKVLIIQMKGATIDWSDDSSFGNITDYGSTGNFEFNSIQSIDGNEVLLGFKLLNDYDISGRIQLITIPDIGDASVCNLTCKPWNGTVGGVLVFDGDNIQMEGNIDVSGKGFQGGNYTYTENAYNNCESDSYYYSNADAELGAMKGEGIADFTTAYIRGKGHVANAGGGGGNHNYGGGGGSNFGYGGYGGYWGTCNDSGFGVQNSGRGGQSLSYDLFQHTLFMGGGGGAGHANEQNDGTPGANGGGIIIARVSKFITNNNYIGSNGANVMLHPDFPNNKDGSGGGGGGGAIWLEIVGAQEDELNVQIKGGNGGSSEKGHGHGGGGGGGILLINDYPEGGINPETAGGMNGLGIDDESNGAMPGGDGGVQIQSELPQVDEPYLPITLTAYNYQSNCDGTANISLQVEGGTPPYLFSLNGTNWQVDSVFSQLTTGTYSFEVADDCMNYNKLITLSNPAPLDLVSVNLTDVRCDSMGSVRLHLSGGRLPLRYRINNTEWQDSNTFLSLESDVYIWEVKDADDCYHSGSFTIGDRTEILPVTLPSEQAAIKKGSSIALPIDIPTPYALNFVYEWSDAPGLSCYNCEEPEASPEKNTTFAVEVTDEFGCMGASQIFIRVDQNEVYIPNIFSPNRDGINDFFKAFADPVKMKTIRHFEIFNRWGAKLFSVKNIPFDSFKGWDGRYNGKRLLPQVLVYNIIIERYDGSIFKDSGSIMLIKSTK